MQALLPNFVTSTTDYSGKSIPVVFVNEGNFQDKLADIGVFATGWAETREFKGRQDDLLLIPGPNGEIAHVLVGTATDGLRNPFTIFAKLARDVPAGHYALTDIGDQDAYLAGLGWCLEQYRFGQYKSEPKTAEARVLVLKASVDITDLLRVVTSTSLVRDLVNTPTNDLGPKELADIAKEIAKAFGAEIRETVGDALLTENFPAIHAVGRASPNEPRLLEITWGAATAPKVSLVGKGVCFDTGGLDIKPSSSMRLMKKDMGGAAHALALGQMIMSANLPVRLQILLPMVENAVAGNAFRPGDILSSRKGLTIEVDNTDAEGRLILCDALALADEGQPELIIDFATLTGAARVALGTEIQPFFTNSEEIARALETASQAEQDPIWRLPLWEPYFDDLKSQVADFANSGPGGFAGAITAALFLQKFITGTKNWVHLDVYAWNRGSKPGRPAGGEALALRATYRFIAERFGQKG